MKRLSLLLAFISVCVHHTSVHAADLVIPATTLYSSPDSGAARFSKVGELVGWSNPGVTMSWHGDLKEAGELRAKIVIVGPEKGEPTLRLTIGDQSKVMTLKSHGMKIVADFGDFTIGEPGYHEFRLESLSDAGQHVGNIGNLLLSGPATNDAHFNLKPRRNAASVHLSYPVPKGTEVSAFYCEMTGVEDPVWTYYMACGWHRGYFGMQVNSATERRIIFSVWDSGGEAIDRKKVDDDNRVKLMAKGEGVYSGDFGNEGTGGHSHLKFPWKTGERQRFLVTAKPVSETHTIYAGYYFRPDLKEWMLISSWKAPKEGKYMRGLYSFSENFIGRNGHVVRKARYGNQWIRDESGKWLEITRAKFSHDGTGKADRLDRFMGLEGNEFFLSHGGFVEGFTKYGEPFDRSPTGEPPEDVLEFLQKMEKASP